MITRTLGATIGRQLSSRFTTASFWISTIAPVALIGVLLFQTAKATDDPSSTMFLAVLSALWIGGSSCVREIVDERKLVQREPHLSLLNYGLAKILHAALVAILQSLILSVFLLLGSVVKIPAPWLWLIMFLTTLSGAMLALLLSSLCDEPATALAWFPMLLVPQVVFGGFLFSYEATKPFALSTEPGRLVEMPAELTRKPVHHWSLRAPGVLSVSRWALESFAAVTLDQDLNDSATLDNAIQVANVIPLTLAPAPVSEPLYRYVTNKAMGTAGPAPKLQTEKSEYILVLVLFVVGQAALLIFILPLRDPRRI